MALTFRRKISVIIGIAALVPPLLLAVDFVSGRVVELELERIEARYVPMLEVGPQLEADFDRVRRGMQDAVAAQDAEALASTAKLREGFIEHLAQAEAKLDADAVAELRAAAI